MRTLDSIVEYDNVVLGGGIGGIATAIQLANLGYRVALLDKRTLGDECNSDLIAGGVSSVPTINNIPIGPDSFESHQFETYKAGDFLNDTVATEFFIRNFPQAIRIMSHWGVDFDKVEGDYPYHLHREGGHSQSRVHHKSDKTGRAIMEPLYKKAMAHEKIDVFYKHMAIDLITKNWIDDIRKDQDVCYGCYVYDIENDLVKTIKSKAVFIATGGAGMVYQITSNPKIATGDGIAMCYRAGLPIVNMEFNQFHPTVFYDAQTINDPERRKLATEAVRGHKPEGAIIKLDKDDPSDERGDIIKRNNPNIDSKSTRDIVSREMNIIMRKYGREHLWLDCTMIPREILKIEYNDVWSYCKKKNIDLSKEPIPITYASHYINGGVLVGLSGQTLYKDGTGLKNCYVIGESAYTGLHGANRLASNSAIEAFVLGILAANHFHKYHKKTYDNIGIPLWEIRRAQKQNDITTLGDYWQTVRQTMKNLAGVSRTGHRLEAAIEKLQPLARFVHKYYHDFFVDQNSLETRNLLQVALTQLYSAYNREETRGCHFREDFPYTKEKYQGWTFIELKKNGMSIDIKRSGISFPQRLSN